MDTSKELQPRVIDLDTSFERILVPLDGSASAEKAFSVARSLGRKPGARIVLVRVVEPRSPELGQSAEESILSARTYLRQVADRLGSSGIDVRTVVRVGPVVPQLLVVAGEEGASLIAMSTHGGRTPEPQPFGTIGQELFRSSSIPILAVPSRAREGDPSQTLRTMLLPVIPTDSAEAVARFSAEFAVSFGIDIVVLLAVVPLAETGRGEAEERVDAEEHLGRLAILFERKRIPTVRLIEAGDPVREILRASRERKADVLAMSLRRRPSQGDAGAGRVVEDVLKESDIPVLAARPHPPQPD